MLSFIAKAQQLVTIAFGIQDPEFVSFGEDMNPIHGSSEVMLCDRTGRLFCVIALPSGKICLKDLTGDEDEEMET